MPRIPKTSPVTGNPLPAHYIHTTSSHFVDQSSRVRILRGVNLCGSSKSPVGRPSWILDGFWEAVEASDGESFVGRPLQITQEERMRMMSELGEEKGMASATGGNNGPGGLLGTDGEADVHLARLRGWGFTMLRFVFTWESLEHEGPGRYDEAFISHFIQVLYKCKSHGFLVFLDPHQDLWSRFLGGSGAPYWTLLACGINPRSLTATQSTILHNEYPVPSNPTPESFPAMIWGTNYHRLANQTVWTLFWAGKDYAPKCIIDGMNIQEYLQTHFINACAHLAKRIKDAGGLLDEIVIGWDSINEPHPGLLGQPSLLTIPTSQALKKGSTPTFAQSLRLGMGRKQNDIEWWDFGSFGPRRNGSVDIDPGGIRLWVESEVADEFPDGDDGDLKNGRWGWKRSKEWTLGVCPWTLHGVWDGNLPEENNADILQPDYFFWNPRNTNAGLGDEDGSGDRIPVDFIEHYFLPHITRYYAALRVHHPEMIPFVQPPVFEHPPWLNGQGEDVDGKGKELLSGRGCFSTHYYDGLTLMTRHWNWFNADALGVLRGKYSSPVFAVKIGEKAIRKSIREQLGVLKGDCAERMGEFPTVIGEIGIPFELDDKYAYGGRDGKGKGRFDYREHVKALDASLSAADGANNLNFTVWTYCPDSSHRWGDGWNGEDLSLWCKDDERTGGSITGRRHLALTTSQPAPYPNPTAGGRQMKDRSQMVVQPVDNEDDSDEQEQPIEGGQEAELQEEHEGDPVSFQVSSTALTLSNLVYPISTPPSLEASTLVALSNPTSSRITLPPAYTSSSPRDTPIDSLKFPSFRSAPLAYAFLSNGARAWKAFVRCYPLATVGLPQQWEWDCQRTSFEMKVKVQVDDRAYSDERGEGEGGWTEQEEPTVIFVPLLHFAKDDVVKRAFGVPTSSSKKTSTTTGKHVTAQVHLPTSAVASTSVSTSASAAASKVHLPSTVNVPLLQDVSSVSLAFDPSTKPANHESMEMTPTSSRSTAQVEFEYRSNETSMDDAFDLDVTVSAGRWTIEGQCLKWWYPIPTSSSTAEGERGSHVKPASIGDGSVEYTITIKRRGGAIDFKRLGVPEYLVGLGPKKGKDETLRIGSNEKKGGLWEKLCCAGCVIC